MKIEDFKLIRNRQRPEFCYEYKKEVGDKKYSIFTMNGGNTFSATVEQKRLDGRFYSEFNEVKKSIDECLTAFENNR